MMAIARRKAASPAEGTASQWTAALRCIVGCAAIAAVTGCGPATATVSGTVTFNGEPVTQGAISLFPADGKGSPAGGVITNGRYSISGVSPGEKIVQLSAPVVAGIRKDDYGNETQVAQELMPPAWGRASKETITVTAGSVTKDFAITGPDPRKK